MQSILNAVKQQCFQFRALIEVELGGSFASKALDAALGCLQRQR
jgi:hypothetical protein